MIRFPVRSFLFPEEDRLKSGAVPENAGTVPEGRCVLYVLWLFLAFLLYFFENNTGTRIVLLCSLALPLIPSVRRAFLAPDPETAAPAAAAARRKALSPEILPEEEEPGNVREFAPGDPLNRIHWKLSARQGSLLVRESEPADTESAALSLSGPDAGEKNGTVPSGRSEETSSRLRRSRKHMLTAVFALILLLLAMLMLLPSARNGAMALANRLFAASEEVNAYAYERFDVPDHVNLLPAALLLAGVSAALIALAALGGRRTALALLAGIVLLQVYFGLSLPGWGNVLLFTLFALRLAGRPLSRRDIGLLLTGIAALSLILSVAWPGVDAATENASESVRDWFSRAAESFTGITRETPAGEKETRRVHTRSLEEGEGEARTEKEYRLVTVEEQQISQPRWIDVMKIILLLLGAVALLILPFLPFLLLNARRKKAAAARTAFSSEDVSEAVCAIFRHVISWLDATGHGAGNLPYREWELRLPALLPEGYDLRFRKAAELFEEAAYSSHPLSEDRRQQALDLLRETEKALWDNADRKTRFRLKYRECLTE